MATVPYAFECDRESGFLPDPNEPRRVGYITALAGLAADHLFPADLTVSVPYGGTPAYRGISSSTTLPGGSFPRLAEVIGIIGKFEWPGGVGDPISIDFWVSQKTATTIKSLQQSTLTTTRVDQLGWWICDFDQETKKWYEVSYPESQPTVTGMAGAAASPGLNVDLTGAPAKDGIDVLVYKVALSVRPAANAQYALRFASSPTTPAVKSWGLVVGPLSP
jgi:hypothetical protein